MIEQDPRLDKTRADHCKINELTEAVNVLLEVLNVQGFTYDQISALRRQERGSEIIHFLRTHCYQGLGRGHQNSLSSSYEQESS